MKKCMCFGYFDRSYGPCLFNSYHIFYPNDFALYSIFYNDLKMCCGIEFLILIFDQILDLWHFQLLNGLTERAYFCMLLVFGVFIIARPVTVA